MHYLQLVLNAMGPNEISQGENTEQGQRLQALMDQKGKESTQETQRD